MNVQLAEDTQDARATFDDIALKLSDLSANLPSGATPIQWNSDFGQTSTLMLTVASPLEDEVALSIRARAVRNAIEDTRAKAPPDAQTGRATLVVVFPRGVPVPTVVELMLISRNASLVPSTFGYRWTRW